MAYEEVNLNDMKYDLELEAFTYECPCGDLFQITMEELEAGEEIAYCPSCSLVVMVEYGQSELVKAQERIRSADKLESVVPPAGAKAIAA
ncbi:DPH-type MB domain-containing protein [Chloropicon primus]|uniref:Diphthamide biosynthesis protein 3 n=1 Tax=Chloropicon primus TaxID=1764295 RepID=A0A5B8MJT9_9CHLO|nr:hypothetical protein A3770_03p21400 [Chloropicon primus]UPQ98834.1 DPH-type MB domain-containing protein [Chloropicon primus]|eukprot:QDZ19622.1 hypothetical protein A3770_03p21400 [Chloropicon primus]